MGVAVVVAVVLLLVLVLAVVVATPLEEGVLDKSVDPIDVIVIAGCF